MKYGYLLYKKPLISEMPDRPINLGDPIQSYAVKLLYKEMGIQDKDMIPIPRYDLSNYEGEECVCVINTCSTYEELAYDSHFMPPSNNLHAVPFSLHLNRDIPEAELAFYKNCEDVGCRDVYTVNKLRENGVNAYLTGCLTLTFPRRSKEIDETANEIYFIDVQSDFFKLIPEEIREKGKKLSSIYRFKITHDSNRMTMEEALEFHRLGEERVELLKNTAKLVITSRLHVAAPCLAMGIPVILTKHDDRFGFIDCFIKSYTNWEQDDIDWNPQPVNIEKEKQIIKEMFFSRIRSAVAKIELNKMWNVNRPKNVENYEPEVKKTLENVAFPLNRPFKYAVLGVVSSTSYFIPDFMRELYPESELACGIDSYVKGEFLGKEVIRPRDIVALDESIIVITAIKGAYAAAKEFLTDRPHVIIAGKNVQCINFDY